MLARRGRAGERDLAHERVRDERLAGPAPVPGTTFRRPAAGPPRRGSRPSRSVVSGVVSAGLATTVLPHSSAGPSLLDSSVVGKFHGTIAPTTPSGRRSTRPSSRRRDRAHRRRGPPSPAPRSARACRPPVQLDPRLAHRLALLGDKDRHELGDVRLERLGARVQELAALRVAEAATRRAERGVRAAAPPRRPLRAGRGHVGDVLAGAGIHDGEGGGVGVAGDGVGAGAGVGGVGVGAAGA